MEACYGGIWQISSMEAEGVMEASGKWHLGRQKVLWRHLADGV
jgi:hypothetical protein